MRDRTEPGAGRSTVRRRAAGLRREEVAADAGISVTWYTWLEQGRPVRVSRRTLVAIARALDLGATERAHLLHLGAAASVPRVEAPVTTEASVLTRMLADGLAPNPAYVVNGLWDVVYANDTACAVFGSFESQPGITNNVLRRLFLDDRWREVFDDWNAVAASAVAQFRAATAHMVGDDRWATFVDRLSGESRDFHDRWREQDIATAYPREKVVSHAVAGRLSFLYASVAPDGEPADVRLIAYVPADDATRNTLARLEAKSGARSKPRAARAVKR